MDILQSEVSDGKICREGEVNPEALLSPEQNSNNKKRKRKWLKKKNTQGAEPVPMETDAEHPQPSHPEPKNTKEEGQVCFEHEPIPLLEITTPIAPEKNKGVESNETSLEHPQVCSNHELAPQVDLRNDQVVGVGSNDVTAENPEIVLPVPHPTLPKDTPQKKKREKKKKKGPNINNAEHPQLCFPVHPELQSKKEKGEEPNEANAEHPQVCPKPESAPQEEKKEGGLIEAHAQHPQPQPCSTPDPTNLINQSREKQRKRGRKRIMCIDDIVENPRNSMQSILNHVQNQIQPNPAIPICPEPAPPLDQSISVDQAIPIDPALSICPKPAPLIGQTIPIDPAETPIQASICPIAAPPADPINPQPVVPMSPAIPTDLEQKTSKKNRRNKKKSVLKSEGVEPNDHDGKPPETPVQRSICTIAAPPIDPTIPKDQTITVDPATPIDTAQKTAKRKRKNKKKSALKSEESEPTAETPVQRSKGLTVTVTKLPLKLLNETPVYDGKPPETPVQRSIRLAAPPIDPTIPKDQTITIDPATPIDAEQKTAKRKRKKKKKSALKSEGSESDKHNTEPTAETPVQRSKGLTVTVTEPPLKLLSESSMSKRKASTAKTRKRTKGLKITKFPFKWHGESSVIPQAYQQPGPKIEDRQRLKSLSNDEEVCFFCGEIGHSLGKCSVSEAGGGKFAKCLFCYEHGHFSYNCPGNVHGVDPKEVAASGPMNKSC